MAKQIRNIKAPETEAILLEAKKIAGSGILGRSRVYGKLLSYLTLCASEGRSPKEAEIAVDVFDKGREFDSNHDSVVRVSVHNLRQKFEKYYAENPSNNGLKLEIPRGEYRLVFESDVSPAGKELSRSTPSIWLGALIGLLILNLVVLFIFRDEQPDSVHEAIGQSQIWGGVLNDTLPLMVVVGDYYIFGELDETGRVSRLIRDFEINSSTDLSNLLVYEPDLAENYFDLDLTYLPRSSALGLENLLQIIHASNVPVQITSTSELRVSDMKSHNIIYLGYISALGMLIDFVFSPSSNLRVGETYDELSNLQTGEQYISGAGIPKRGEYQDYGLISSFPGPSGNQFLIIAGTRDAGVLEAADLITDINGVELLERTTSNSAGDASAFEALYRVVGFDRTNLDANLVHFSSLDRDLIWGSEVVVQ